jgi:hypothetical protein
MISPKDYRDYNTLRIYSAETGKPIFTALVDSMPSISIENEVFNMESKSGIASMIGTLMAVGGKGSRLISNEVHAYKGMSMQNFSLVCYLVNDLKGYGFDNYSELIDWFAPSKSLNDAKELARVLRAVSAVQFSNNIGIASAEAELLGMALGGLPFVGGFAQPLAELMAKFTAGGIAYAYKPEDNDLDVEAEDEDGFFEALKNIMQMRLLYQEPYYMIPPMQLTSNNNNEINGLNFYIGKENDVIYKFDNYYIESLAVELGDITEIKDKGGNSMYMQLTLGLKTCYTPHDANLNIFG